jgi:hypothetical protein
MVEKQVNIYEQLLEVEVRQKATGKGEKQDSTPIFKCKDIRYKNGQMSSSITHESKLQTQGRKMEKRGRI